MTEAAVQPRGNAVAQSSEAGMGDMGRSTGRSDGRNRRAAETRRKIIAAAKVMIAETGTAPTVVGVAKRADVSVRSVFQHFGDVESLFVTVFDNVREGALRLQAPSGEAPLPARIDWVIDHLAEMYDKVVPLRLAAGQFGDTNQALVERRETARRDVTSFVRQAFAPEFADLDEAAKAELQAAFEAAL